MSHLFIKTEGHGPPLVLLHGWGFSSEIWAPILPVLTQHFQVTLVDLPGHGQSMFLPQFNEIHEVAHYLVRHTPPNAIWVGWSLGGLIALACAQQYPEHIKQLLQVASTPKFVTSEDWNYGVKPNIMTQFEQQLQANTQATLTRFVTLQTLGLPNAKQDARELAIYIQEHLPSRAGLYWGLHILRTLDLRPLLASIQCPIHYLLGAKDSLVPLALKDYLTQNYPHIGVEVLPTAAHMPFFSHPALFLQWLNHATHS
jgi:pimeloyl-[acyl-carrier protein] methyl ester esterase